jgi:hypothetical protein
LLLASNQKVAKGAPQNGRLADFKNEGVWVPVLRRKESSVIHHVP